MIHRDVTIYTYAMPKMVTKLSRQNFKPIKRHAVFTPLVSLVVMYADVVGSPTCYSI